MTGTTVKWCSWLVCWRYPLCSFWVSCIYCHLSSFVVILDTLWLFLIIIWWKYRNYGYLGYHDGYPLFGVPLQSPSWSVGFLGNGNPPSWKENSMSTDLVAMAILCLPILRSEQAVLLTKCTLENQHGTQKWKFGRWVSFVNWVIFTRWAPTSYKLSYNPYKYKWPYKWVTGVIPLLIGVITQFITGRDPPCRFHVD